MPVSLSKTQLARKRFNELRGFGRESSVYPLQKDKQEIESRHRRTIPDCLGSSIHSVLRCINGWTLSLSLGVGTKMREMEWIDEKMKKKSFFLNFFL